MKKLDRIAHLKQDKENNCGQTCIAIITGMRVREVEKKMNRFSRTKTHDLVYALQGYGFTVPKHQLTRCDSKYPWETNFPELCIVKITYEDSETGKSDSHWIVKHGIYIYDPALNEVITITGFQREIAELSGNIRPTSYLEITE